MTSTRLAAAAVGLAIILPAVVWGGGLAVVIIVALAMGISLDEYARMAFPEDHRVAFGWLALIEAVFVGYAVWGTPQEAIAAVAFATVATMVMVTVRPGPRLEDAADRVGRYVLGMLWISQLTFLVRLRAFPDGVVWVLLALSISWLSDTGAYFAGRAFGKHRLYERISPKKTWEGLWGGVATAVAGALLVRAMWLPDLLLVDAIVLGAAGSLMSVMGDLAESLLKRSFGVKDSGWILPGHGGMLDRIDSVFFVAPTVWAYMVLVRGS
ncbi:MAG: phosphatidate cytidylyltransferase [Alphaproteobacteria bacterium]|nr:phosphatidate cytidylyltransferase [Alphaproteobacteria bacterium]